MSGDAVPGTRPRPDLSANSASRFERDVLHALASGPTSILAVAELLRAPTDGPADDLAADHPLAKLRRGERLHRLRLSVWTEQGERHVELSSTSNGNDLVVFDCTDTDATLARLRHESDTDAVTGVHTVRSLRRRLDRSLAEHRDVPGRVAVLSVHLDGFASVADAVGQTLADALLTEVSSRLVHGTRTGELVARLGSDSFAVVLEPVGDRQDAIAAAERLRRAVNVPITFGHRSFSLTSSIGVAFSSARTTAATDLLSDADEASRQAKAQGRNDWAVFDDGVRSRAQARRRSESALDDALSAGLVTAAYQSIVDARTGRCSAYEALPRVRSHNGSLQLLPGAPGLAEESGRDLAINKTLLDHSAEQLVRFHHRQAAEAGPRSMVRLAVRLSWRTAVRADLYAFITESLEEHDVAPASLIVLLPERAFLERATATCAAFDELLHDGVTLAADDHGTGLLSLGHLADLGIRAIRLHPASVGTVDLLAPQRLRVESLVTQAHQLGLTVVANGVVRGSQARTLVELGCDSLQGDWVAPPQTAAEAEAELEAD